MQRNKHRFSRRGFNKALSFVLSVAMVVTSSNLEYVGKAYAEDLTPAATSATTSAASTSDDAATTGQQAAVDGTSDETPAATTGETSDGSGEAGSEASDAASDDAAVAPAAGDASATENPATPVVKHEAISADLPVKLSFTLDDNGCDPVAVTLQLQSRTASWDASASTWGDFGDWADVDGAKKDLSSDELKASADADSQYTFPSLSVQTVTEEGAYESRTQYRVIESVVDGAKLAYDSTSPDGVMTYKATVEKAASEDVLASDVAYSVSVPEAAALLVSTDDSGADVSCLASDAPESIATDGATSSQAQEQAAPVFSMGPMAEGSVVVTFNANGGSGTMSAQTMTSGVATALSANKFTRDGYTFLGWNTAEDGSGTAYADGATVTLSADVTLYAQWSKTYGPYTVTNATKNYADGDTTTFNLSKKASVTIGGVTTTYEAGADFEVPADGSFTISFDSTSDSITATMKPKTGQSAIGAASASLSASATSATLTSQEAAADIDLYKEWKDGESTSKPSSLNLSIQYSSDGGATWTTLTEANMATLGLASVPAVPENSGNDKEWIYSFYKSLTKFTATGADVIYRLTENEVPSGYASSYSGAYGNVLVNTKLSEYKATKTWADGGNKYNTRIAVDAWVASLTCKKASLSGDPVSVSLTTTDSTAEGYIVVTQKGNGWSISMPNAWGYDANDFPYSYYLTEPTTLPVADGSSAMAGSYYVPDYLNDGNYASIGGALYSGGMVTNYLYQTTKFTATKKWADDATTATVAARPTATLELFRYPDDGTSNYTTASPVPGITSYTLDNTATGAFDFTVASNLPEYDSAGYKYVYFVKETLSGGSNSYKKVFKNNGSETGNDTFLFNGGELDNTITGTVNKSVTKTWVAAARQDVDAKVTISIDQTDTHTGATVKDFKTEDLTGFGTENSSKTVDFTGMPMYDEDGYKYSYSVRESGLQTKVGGTFEDATSSSDGSSFVTADGYRYSSVQSVDGDKTTITNRLQGDAQVVISKTFTNGLLASPSDLTYTVYRNGTPIGTKTVSYSGTVGDPITVDPISIASYEDLTTKVDSSATGLLPRYDANGVQYTYTVAETSKPSAYATSTSNQMKEGTYAQGTANAGQKYSYDAASVSNSKPVDSMGVGVHKTWVDAGDVMNRETVHLALQYNAGTAEASDWVTINTGSIDTTTDYTWVSVPDSVPEGSTGTATYQDLYTAWINAGRTVDAAGAFRVVETALGSDNVVADGDSSIPTDGSSGHRSGFSFVSTVDQNYDVSPEATINSNFDYTLTNTRVGTEKITLTKNWVDGSNIKGNRPASITFTVSASADVFTDAQGVATNTKDFTATGSGDTWTLDTGWLQKYDSSTGAFITYTIAESAESIATVEGLGYAISGKQTSYTVGEQHHTGDIETWEFTNSLSGSVTPLMNKIWKDLGDETTISNRPDIYPILFRSYTDATGTHYEKMSYQDRDWNTNKVTASWWQCTYISQPRYNAEGYEYTYYVAESYSSASHGFYQNTGGYDSTPDASGNFTEDPTKRDTITVDGTTYDVAKLDNDTGTAGTIVNKPVSKRRVSGQKIWAGLPSGFSMNNLPNVTFELYSCHYGDDPTKASNLTDTGLSTTLSSGASSFSFASVDRFDSEGKPYIYVVKETSPVTMDLVYQIEQDPTNGLVVTNNYKVNQGYGITFTKDWVGVPTGLADKDKPSVTLTLARYLTSDAAGTTIVGGTREAAFATAAGNGNENAVTINSDASSVVWSKLAYYGPNGNPYKYVVEETGLPDGYVVYSYDPVNGTVGSPVAATKIGSATAYEAPVTGTYDSDTSTGSGTAGLDNKYGEDLGKVSLTKTWATDQTYSVSPRPSSISGTLYRTSTTDGKETVLSNVELTSTDSWTKTIENLELYSPKGEQYTYSFEETSVPGYATPATYSPATVTLTKDATSALQVTNTAQTTSLSVTKSWKYGTDTTPTSAQLLFDAGLVGIPTTITYRFQYSTDGGTTWSDLKKADGTTYVEQQVKQGSTGSFPAAGITSLPASVMVGSELKGASYRAYEYSLTYSDGTTKTRTSAPTGATDTGSIASVTTGSTGSTTAGSTTAATTAVTNSVPMRKITITKTWDDEYNRDGKRPSSVEFTITRTGIETTSDSKSEKVTLTSANKTDDNTWTASYYVPTYWNVDTSVTSTYTVAETAIDSKAGYTTYAALTADPTTEGSSVTIDGATTDASAYFKNSRAHGTFTLTPAKVWSYEGTTYDGTTDLPEWLRAYLPSSITFTLQASTDGTNWYDTSDTTHFGTDFSGISGFSATKTTSAIDGTTGKITVGSWADLPRYASDTNVSNLVKYQYRVTEALVSDAKVYSSTSTVVDGSTADATKATVTETNTFARTKLAITKAWVDALNKYNTRPSALKYEIQYSTNGTDWTTVPDGWTNGVTTNGIATVTDATNHSNYGLSIDSLPKYAADGMTEYQYRAVETALVYGTDIVPGTSASDNKPYYVSSTTTSAVSGSTTTYTTAFTNTMPTTSFSVTKKWVDSTPGIASQVSKIGYYLQSSTDGTTWSYVTNAALAKDSWTIDTGSAADVTKAMSDLPKFDSNGNAYQYRAIEGFIVVSGKNVNANNVAATDPTSGTVGGFTYSSSTAAGSTSSTLTNTAVTTSTKAAKVWKDNSGGNKSLPSSITFHLKQGTTTLGTDFNRKLSDPWTAVTWTGLPASNAAGTAYSYTVTEDAVPGYTTSIAGTQAAGFTVTNTPIPVTISKVAANGTTKLAGATFTLKGTFTNGTAEETRGWTSSATNAWDLTGLLIQDNVYTLTETAPPTGYTLPASTVTYLKVDATGKLFKSYDKTLWTAVTSNALAITDDATKVTVKKVDASGKALAGARFTISGTFVNASDQTQTTTDAVDWTSDGTNSLVLQGRLIAGQTYTVNELASPAGYLTMQAAFTLTMGTDGRLTAGTLPAGVTVTVGYDTTNGATVTIADQPTVLKAMKFASTDTAHATPVAGAVFTVTGTFADGQTAKTFSSTADAAKPGNLTASLITGYEYVIQETTAPAGYELSNPNPTRTIRITSDGQLQESVSGVWTDVSNNAMAFEDVATALSLVKQDEGTQAQVGGSTYTLTGAFADGSTTQTLSPTATDAATLTTKFIANETSYTLKESTPIPGYKASPLTDSYPAATLANGAMTLRMNSYGKLFYASSAAGGWTAVKGNSLVMKDEKNSLTINKVLPDGTAATATFTITGIFANSGGKSATQTIVNNATSGTMAGNLIAGNSYTVAETVPPAGYDSAASFTFTMNADGTITTTATENLAFSTSAAGDPIVTVTDQPTKVTLTKTGAAGNLAGAVFTITPEGGAKFADGSTSMTWDTSKHNGDLDTGVFVAGQTYDFHEATIPDGYEGIADFRVQMSLRNVLTLLDSYPTSVVSITNTSGASPSSSVTVANTQNSFTLTKRNADGTAVLTGATFTIAGTFAKTSTETVDETRTYSAGSTVITGEMVAGKTYTVTETVPPAGCKTVSSSFQVAMGQDGKLSAVGTLPSGVSLSTDGLTLTVDDTQNSFTLTKKGANDAALAGATFTLVNATDGGTLADGTTSYEFTTTASASVVTGKLVASTATETHTYKLEETTPAKGYTVTAESPVYLRMDTAGNLSSCTTATGDFSPVTGNAITMTDAQNKLSLTKRNADDTSTLTGATFTIAPTSATGTFADGTSASRTLASDGTALVGQLVAGTSYTVTETVPPAGYYIATAPFSVTMDEHGVLTVTGGTGVSVSNAATPANPGGLAAITVTDPQNVFSVTKTDAEGTAIAGAHFELSCVGSATFAHATAAITWTSTTDAHVITGELVAGSVYKLAETTPAPGYTSVSDVYLRMSDQGILSKSPNGTDGWTAVGTTPTTNALSVSDVANVVTLAKQDANGDALAGATFVISGSFANGDTSRTWVSTTAPESLTGEMVAGQSYTFHETLAPAGYLTVPDFSVTMGADGKLTAGTLPSGTTGSVTVTYDSGTATNAIVVSDVEDTFTLNKLNERGTALMGATFTVTPEEGKKFADGTTTPKTILSGNSSEEWAGKLVTGVTYTFTETTSPAAYVTMQPFTMTIASDGTISVGGDGASAVTVDATSVSARNSLMTAAFSLKKVDATDDTAITSKKTTFTITSTPSGSTSSVTLEKATDENGYLNLSNLAKGTWVITEKTADPNYVNKGFSCTFTVTDGCQGKTLTIDTNGDTNNAQLFQLDVTSDDEHVTETGLANARRLGTVNIKKLGVGDDAAGLDGVTFALYEKTATGDKLLISSTTSDTGEGSGTLSFVNLPWGDYYVVETAVPGGYQVDSTHHEFSIGYGDLTKNFTDASAISNTKNTFTLTKNVEGATFEIAGTFAYGTSPVTLTGATSYTETGLLVGGNTYTVTETVPAPGYATVSEFHVTMGTDGKLTSTDLPSGVTLADNVLSVVDPQNSLTVEKDNEKQGEDKAKLGGVTFELRTTDASGTLVDTWTTELDSEGKPVDNPRAITGKLTAGVVYRLSETSPSFGYTTGPDVFLRMDNAGQLWSDVSASGSFSTKIDGNALVITDTPTSLSFTKVDEDGVAPLADAWLTFTADIRFTASFEVKSLSTGASFAKGKMAAGHEYTVAETMPTPGHIISPWTDTYADAALNSDGEITVKMENAGQLQYKTTAGTWADIKDNAIVMKDAQTDISIEKVDESGDALAGAQFELSGVDGATFAKSTGPITWTSETDAHSIVGELSAGLVYKLTETVPAEGYTLAPDVYLYLSGQGVLYKSTTDKGPWAVVSSGATANLLTVTDTQNDITISKTDADGAALAGSTFELSGVFADGSETEGTITWTSGDTPRDFTGELIAGNVYKLTETNPAKGYTTASDVYLKVDEAGKLWSDTSATGSFETSVSDNALLVMDVQNSFDFEKVGENSQPLTGATFQLRGTFADGTTTMDLFSGAPTANVTGKLVAGESYTLVETVMPAGYTAIDPITLTVSADGRSLSFSPSSDHLSVTDEANGATVTVVDDPVSISIEKTDRDTGATVAGATIEVDGTFADGSTSKTFTSSGAAFSFDAQLIAGNTYTLKETSAPDGYDSLADAATFTVDEYGKVTITNDAGGAVSVAADGRSIVVADTATVVPAEPGTTPKTSDPTPDYLLPLVVLGGAFVVGGMRRRRRGGAALR